MPSFFQTLRTSIGLQVFFTLSIGVFGAFLATAGGLPAPALIGSAIAVSCFSFCRFPTYIPDPLRNLAFAAIGCSLGSGISGNVVDLALKWPASLVGLMLVIVLVMLLSTVLLTRCFHQSRETAFLASSPGALAYSLAIAAEGVGDARAIIIIQSIRLLFITAGLPLILDALDLRHGHDAHKIAAHITVAGTTGLFAATIGAGYLLTKSKMPAAYLIAGVCISGLLHVTGVVSGRPQTWFLSAGFVVTGGVIGFRFTKIPLAGIRLFLTAALTVTAASSIIAACVAAWAAHILDIPFGQLWVSYAPGGVEAMAAMALSLGYDTGFVAVHHLFRIILLLFVLPGLLRYFTGRNK